MAEWSLVINGLGQVRERLGSTAAALRPAVAAAMHRVLTEAVTYARGRYLSGGTTPDRLAQRTGALVQAFVSEVGVVADGVTGRLGYLHRTPPGAAVHEGWPDGRASTTIRPRRGRYLAIPLPGAGSNPGGPRALTNSFVARSRAGNLLIFEKTPSGIQPRYLLRTEVVVPARPALRPTVALFTPRLLAALRQEAHALLSGRSGGRA